MATNNDSNKMSREEAGRKGGEATASTHGRNFYEEIASEGNEQSPGQLKEGDKHTIDAARRSGQSPDGNALGDDDLGL